MSNSSNPLHLGWLDIKTVRPSFGDAVWYMDSTYGVHPCPNYSGVHGGWEFWTPMRVAACYGKVAR